MEISGKSFSDIIKEAEEKGLQVVLVGAGAETGKHAALLATMSKNKSILLVPIAELPQEDQDKIKPVPIESRDFLKEIIDGAQDALIKNMGKMRLEADHMDDIILQEKINAKTPKPLPKPNYGLHTGHAIDFKKTMSFKKIFKGRKKH